MRVFHCVALVLCLGAVASAQEKKPDPAAELKAMVGKWSLTKAELGGMDVLDHLKDLKFEIREGGKYTAQLGEEKDEGTFTADPGKTPKEMDIKATGGPLGGQTVKAIYKLDGDTMTICYDLGGGERPTKFETKADTKLFLAVYQRAKK
jgi:uncharacterized protein (TIGR03067 family)